MADETLGSREDTGQLGPDPRAGGFGGDGLRPDPRRQAETFRENLLRFRRCLESRDRGNLADSRRSNRLSIVFSTSEAGVSPDALAAPVGGSLGAAILAIGTGAGRNRDRRAASPSAPPRAPTRVSIAGFAPTAATPRCRGPRRAPGCKGGVSRRRGHEDRHGEDRNVAPALASRRCLHLGAAVRRPQIELRTARFGSKSSARRSRSRPESRHGRHRMAETVRAAIGFGRARRRCAQNASNRVEGRSRSRWWEAENIH